MISRNLYPLLKYIRWASSGPHPTKHPRHRIPKLKAVSEGILLEKNSDTKLFYNPPASPPDYRVTPYILLPDDVKKLAERPVSDGKLPPPLSPIKKKKYHLTEEDIKEIKALRRSGISRSELSKRYNASRLFIGMISPLNKEKLQEIEKKDQEIKNSWSEHKKEVKMNRYKRKMLWKREYN
ncbi:hypothetical protein T552_01574 [Pneumocystis carinii B80]|uniref:Uncharacterized protein n=1 Tax=Pneumocystis carinii (strain B80) TaxID=1408658 RepID=A0A0W4ZKP6_PNEC8|nr:hypothetical protein T552_01574 [Pneumocystis carinii B80]KTW28944.1 hypothetical protein T552_01574 [Pneumocystis carinii B80]